MLGKTNIIALSEGVMITDIKDFNWIKIQAGTNGNFKKVIYEEGYLAAITMNGEVAYTTDGETWQASSLKYKDCMVEDIAWDGSQFLIAGSYKDTIERADKTSGEYEIGFLAVTTDFSSYEYFSSDTNNIAAMESYNYYSKYYAVYPVNGKWGVIAKRMWRGNSASSNSTTLKMLVGGMNKPFEEINTIESRNIGEIFIGKNLQGILVTNVVGNKGYIYIIDGNTFSTIKIIELSGYNQISLVNLPVFECKAELYYTSINDGLNYRFVKVLSSGEEIIMSTNINYGFVDGVYFRDCKIFINNHEMLILKNKESISDKALEDLIEIAPENIMTCITKAFGQLFIFGNQGLVLRSSTDGSSEETILLQTISAKKALMEAKEYTKQLYKELEDRISILEAGMATETG